MATGTTKTATTQPTLSDYEKRIDAQIEAADARIAMFEEKAKDYRLKAEIAAIDGLKAGREDLERKLQALSTTAQANVVRAKADIDEAATALKTALDRMQSTFARLTEEK